MSGTGLHATAEASDDLPDAPAVVLRIVNGGGTAVELLNPDLGSPAPAQQWPWSGEAYRASLLMSYGYLVVELTDADGEKVDAESVSTWATPALRPPVVLGPGDSYDVPVPLGPFFTLTPGAAYRASIEYGDETVRVHAQTTIVP